MNIVLTSINNFQEYILINIKQLICLGHKNIYVITNECFFESFHEYKENIRLIKTEELNDSYHYCEKSRQDTTFRNGFWMLTSARFFYIYELMNKYNITNVIHLENDVLIYYNCNMLSELLNKNYLYIPFDTFHRNIASIVYIPNATLFKQVLDNYDFSLNDMENFSRILHRTSPSLITNFPIFIVKTNDDKTNDDKTNDDKTNDDKTNEYKFVTHNFNHFKPFIFDAAAMGQYIGGINPENCAGNTIGFINETCIIKYNHYAFEWQVIDHLKKPFLIVNHTAYPIFNLHIHCKNLALYSGS